MKTIEEYIDLLPETIYLTQKQEKAFLEITSGHVYYSKKHDNRGNLNCVFVSCRGKGNLQMSLHEAYEWITSGLEKGEIKELK